MTGHDHAKGVADGKRQANSLIQEKSPYLQQHAYNPVEWMPWGEDARQRAIAENKLMLVSIGYSSCHWCHVMERECFENETLAAYMNEHFINVKVDREERPDVDQVYMEAVQLMSRQGGWPLNCFTTPDGLPIYGGTYYPPARWKAVLEQLVALWAENPGEVRRYGQQLQEGISLSGKMPVYDSEKSFEFGPLDECIVNWKRKLDHTYGGPDKAPKFPMPGNYGFLLQYAWLRHDEDLLKHVEHTLLSMARGGIYDHIGGGFARYSTDVKWKVPHFEKMLYDNAQLLDLYSEAYKATGQAEFLYISKDIVRWLLRDMKHPEGCYYSAIDADSEGVEGLYYTWTQDELTAVAGIWEEWRKFYYSDEEAEWEDRLIPVRKDTFKELSKEQKLAQEETISAFSHFNEKLLQKRQQKIAPLTDTKCLTSWNAMLAGALARAYSHTGESLFKDEAIRIIAFLERNTQKPDSSQLWHAWKDGTPYIEGFLEDYAFFTEAYLCLYQATLNEDYVHKALQLTEYTIENFYDSAKGLFYFTPHEQGDLIARPAELDDNVIPASNSVMAHVLDTLHSLCGVEHFREITTRMLSAIEGQMVSYGQGYSNWAKLYMKRALGHPELAVCGPDTGEILSAATEKYRPLLTLAGALNSSSLSIFQNRIKSGSNLAYLCIHNTCKAPFTESEQITHALNTIYRP